MLIIALATAIARMTIHVGNNLADLNKNIFLTKLNNYVI